MALVFCHRFASPVTDGALLCTGSSRGRNKTVRVRRGKTEGRDFLLSCCLPERWHRVSLPLAEDHDIGTGAPLHQTSLLAENRRRFATDGFYPWKERERKKENRVAKRNLDLPRVGHRISLRGARQHHAGSRTDLFPTPFHLTGQRGCFAADRL